MRWMVLLALGSACGDAEEAAAPTTACDAGWTGPTVGETPTDQWPAGLAQAIDLHNRLAGRYRTTECGDADNWVDVKLTLPDAATLEVLAEPPPGGAPCGCTEDPTYAADNGHLPLARGALDLYLEDYPDYALDQSLNTLTLTYFQQGEALLARACGRVVIDADLNDVHQEALLILRVDGGGALSAFTRLEGAESLQDCALEQFVRLD